MMTVLLGIGFAFGAVAGLITKLVASRKVDVGYWGSMVVGAASGLLGVCGWALLAGLPEETTGVDVVMWALAATVLAVLVVLRAIKLK
jgi:hypothetical protein